MTLTVLLGFVAACVLLAVTPGPNMALIIASTLGGGLKAGLVTLAGCLTGLSILVLVATIGMNSVMVLMAEWFDVFRLAGALYLVLLGILQLHQYSQYRRSKTSEIDTGLAALPGNGIENGASFAGWRYAQGVMVALSNPKLLLFLGAFFPQFVVPGSPPGPQLAALGVTFILTLAVVDLTYTMAIARARATVDFRRLRVLDAVSGMLLLAGGLVLATARRP